MTQATQAETLGFQTEVKQLLHLMIHSLYSNKEIFLRELISNASDAIDKLRFVALENEALLSDDAALRIRIEFDQQAKTVTIDDNGIGMDRDEVIKNLGTIAKSGTAEFLNQLTGDQKKDSHLIGQFGVGFYSSFIVAQQVEVITRKAGAGAEDAICWRSAGEGEFSLEPATKPGRGTRITLHLKDDEAEFANSWRLRSLVRKYSDHISVPVEMLKEAPPANVDEQDEDSDSDAKAQQPVIEFEKVNTATALWTRSRSDIKDDEYQQFYKHISHDFADALTWSHNRVEGKNEYTSILYIPSKAPFDLYNREGSRGLHLYVQRVFIMDEVEQFLPMYLRFVRGVIDSNNLPLNVSREILQSNKLIDAMRSALTKRVLDMLEKMAKKDEDTYNSFWDQFGQVIKEGPGEDFANKDKIAKLLRFSSTVDDQAVQRQSLSAYIKRMQPQQDKIYYAVSDQFETAKNSPHLEVFRKKGIEVLIHSDRVDEWLMSHLHEFEGKTLQDVAKGELDLGAAQSDDEKQAQAEAEKTYESLLQQVKEQLKDDVQDVRITHRLTDSPACLVVGEHDMGTQMRQIMQAAGQKLPENKPFFELNPQHPLVIKINQEADTDRANDLIQVIYEQARLAQGSALKDPAGYVRRLNALLLALSA